MAPDSFVLDRWSVVTDWLARFADIDASALAHKAFRRARAVRNAGDLLRLAVIWTICGLSLRNTCAWAADSGLILTRSDGHHC